MEDKVKEIKVEIKELEGRIGFMGNKQEISELKLQAIRIEVTKLDKRISEDYKSILENDKRMESLMSEQRNQNSKILSNILDGHQKEDKRLHEYKTTKWGDIVKIIITALTAGGIGYVIIEQIMSTL